MSVVSFSSVSLAIALITAPLAAAFASPPPPPPPYVMKVGNLLTAKGAQIDREQLADFVASDVKIYVNSKLVASGKAQWLHQTTAPFVDILTYSEGWKDGGSLVIVDQYDRVDRSKSPPGFFADPRPVTRTTLYRFAIDGKIHSIQMLTADGFWMKP